MDDVAFKKLAARLTDTGAGDALTGSKMCHTRANCRVAASTVVPSVEISAPYFASQLQPVVPSVEMREFASSRSRPLAHHRPMPQSKATFARGTRCPNLHLQLLICTAWRQQKMPRRHHPAN